VLCYRGDMKNGLFSNVPRVAGLLPGLAACVAALLLTACSAAPEQPESPTLGDMLATANVERVNGGITYRNVWTGPRPCAYYGYGPAYAAGFGSCFHAAYFYPYYDLYTFYGWRPYYAWGRYGYGGIWYPHPWYARVRHPGYHYPHPGERNPGRSELPDPVAGPDPVDELPPLNPVPVTSGFQIVAPVIRTGPNGPVWSISPTPGTTPVSSLGRSGFPGAPSGSAAAGLTPVSGLEQTRSAGNKKQPGISRTGQVDQRGVSRQANRFNRSVRQPRSPARAPSRSSRSYSRPSSRASSSSARIRSSRPTRSSGAARISRGPEP